MDKLTFRKYLAWLVVALFLMILPTLGHANITLTGKEFQALLAEENIVGYELTKTYNPSYNPYNPGQGSLYTYQGKPVYYDPYMPETARSIKPISQSPVRYAEKTPIKDLLNLVDVNGKKIFCVPDGTGAIAQSGAGAIAKRALTGLPALLLTELANPAVLADGTIAGSGYELGVLSDSSDPEITAAELKARIAQSHGIDTSESSFVWGEPTDYTAMNLRNNFSSLIGKKIYIAPYLFTIYHVIHTSGYYVDGNPGATYSTHGTWGWVVNMSTSSSLMPSSVAHYGGAFACTAQQVDDPAVIGPKSIGGFDPSAYPHLYNGSQGAFNALAELIKTDAKVEMIPLDPSLMPTYFPDTSTGFMRFGGKTDIAGENYLLGPYGTLYKKPDSMEVDPSLPYVDPASIGYIANSPAPGGVPNIIPGSIPGIPQGSTILGIDPVTGLIKFKTPSGYESSKYGSPEEIQELQRKTASPYYDGSGQPWSHGSSSSNSTSNSTTNTTVITDREDYSVNIPDLPGLPQFPSEFDVPEPEPWPWLEWVQNPFGELIDSMEITANGSPYLDFTIDFPFYPPFTIRADFSEYESALDTMGAFSVMFAYYMAILFVVRAKK